MDLNVIITSALNQIWKTKRYSYLDRARPDFGFLYLIRGAMDYKIGDRIISLRENDVIFLPKGVKYEVAMHTDDGAVESLLVNFDIKGNNAAIIAEEFGCFNDYSQKIKPIMEKIVLTYCEGGDERLIALSNFYLFLYKFITETQSDKTSDIIKKAKALLTDSANYSMDKIAQMLFLSSSGLRKKFKEQEGMSPVRFRLLSRLEKSKQLLVSTDLSIQEIAHLCGFYDTAYFYKQFCKNTGLTPKEYKKQIVSY